MFFTNENLWMVINVSIYMYQESKVNFHFGESVRISGVKFDSNISEWRIGPSERMGIRR